jgi:hypothetical protein
MTTQSVPEKPSATPRDNKLALSALIALLNKGRLALDKFCYTSEIITPEEQTYLMDLGQELENNIIPAIVEARKAL